MDPRMAALLYAGDRYETRELLLDARSRVELVICDRYTPSNLAHQGAKAKTSGLVLEAGVIVFSRGPSEAEEVDRLVAVVIPRHKEIQASVLLGRQVFKAGIELCVILGGVQSIHREQKIFPLEAHHISTAKDKSGTGRHPTHPQASTPKSFLGQLGPEGTLLIGEEAALSGGGLVRLKLETLFLALLGEDGLATLRLLLLNGHVLALGWGKNAERNENES